MLEGEPGTGKTTLARAVHQSRTPAAHLRVFDANDHSPRWIADLIDELATGGGTLVLTHLDRLPPDEMGVLVEVLDPHRESIDADGHWVVATIGKQRSDRDPDLTTLLSLFPGPSRCRRCATTSRTSQSWYRTCWADSPGAATWGLARGDAGAHAQPVAGQRRAALPGAAHHGGAPPLRGRRDGRPAAGMSRHHASRAHPLEAIECDAIVDALLDTDGNKAEAARQLGMSRATIYRKIRGYGLSLPVGSG